MNAIDTNVLVRLFVNDNKAQAKKALQFVKDSSEVFISSIVLVETVWVLESCYEIKKKALVTILKSLLEVRHFVLEHTEATWAALGEFKDVSADFSDCLIGAIAKEHGCISVATFDKKAAKLSIFDSL